MKKNRLLVIFMGVCCVGIYSALSAESTFFYNPPQLSFILPPGRFEKTFANNPCNWLTKIRASYTVGRAGRGYDSSGHSTNALDIYGPTNMLYIGENVAKTPTLQNFANFIAANPVLLIGQGGTFGQLKFPGTFKSEAAELSLHQNIKKGLFCQFDLSMRKISVTNITIKDLSPESGNGGYNQRTPQWMQLKNNLDVLLANYGLSPITQDYKRSGIGDFSSYLGWQRQWDDEITENYFCALTFKVGFLFPIGSVYDSKEVFSFPTRKYGVQGVTQLQVGVAPWLVVNVHGAGTLFAEGDEQFFCILTFSGQTGWLKLAGAKAREQRGFLWDVGGEASVDKFISGLNLRLGYSYTQQQATKFYATEGGVSSSEFVAGDQRYASWNQHVFKVMLDYDASVNAYSWKWAPRIAAFYSFPFAGKNVFKTELFGGSLGIDIRWAM